MKLLLKGTKRNFVLVSDFSSIFFSAIVNISTILWKQFSDMNITLSKVDKVPSLDVSIRPGYESIRRQLLTNIETVL